jgi:hypothetical protein
LEESGAIPSADDADMGKNEGNVIGGYKATLKNPNVSEEAKVRKYHQLAVDWLADKLCRSTLCRS